MLLYEYEGKKLLEEAGISVPKSIIISYSELTAQSYKQVLKQVQDDNVGVVLKAQVLSGKRAQAGGIMVINNPAELDKRLTELFTKTINQEKVETVLVEEKVDFDKEYYLSLSYDTDVRGPVLTISDQGGTGIEERGAKSFPIDILDPQRSLQGVEIDLDKEVLGKVIKAFFDNDCLLLEINPLVKTKTGEWMALDAKVRLDDNAFGRHQDWNFPPRSVPGHIPTPNEIEAKKIDETDYRGTAGSAYFDFDGDIAILASGGGASLTAMDTLIAQGGKPANYTEYSGNPPKEKVEKLTQIVLSKPNLHGLWVVGAVANFTDIYQTLLGFLEGLRKAEESLGKKFDFPIVIRRGGPNAEQAFEMLRQVSDFDLRLYGPETSITESAKIMANLAKKYATSK